MVPEYQVSALPWITASTLPVGGVVHRFPWATKYFTLQNDSASVINVGFSPSVTGSKYFPVGVSGSLSLDVRIVNLYLTGTAGSQYSLFAGLTTIDRTMSPNLLIELMPSGSSI
jgi:hypothetical protein